MSVVDQYAPCPCGSGKKYKFCCIKADHVIEQVQRLEQTHQVVNQRHALEAGLAKYPDVAWLAFRLALLESSEGRPDLARKWLERILEKTPEHPIPVGVLVRMILEHEGPSHAAGYLQNHLRRLPADLQPKLALAAQELAEGFLARKLFSAALAHVRLGDTLQAVGATHNTNEEAKPKAGERPMRESMQYEMNEEISPWQKEPFAFLPLPDDAPVDPGFRARFQEGVNLAEEGFWSAAAGIFYEGDAYHNHLPVAVRNLGLCRLFLADYAGAVEALRRYRATLGVTSEAAEWETLCQQIEPLRPEDQIEQVRLTWPIRNRDGLLETLRNDPLIALVHRREPDQAGKPAIETFTILDKPQPSADSLAHLKVGDIPVRLAQLVVTEDELRLESYEDQRLEGLRRRLVKIVGDHVPPVQPKTKVIGLEVTHHVLTRWDWMIPKGVPDAKLIRLSREQRFKILREVWPNTPHPALRGKTPLEVKGDPNAAVELRAVLLQMEYASALQGDQDLAFLREMLDVEPETELDASVSPFDVTLARLHLLPAEKLTDDALLQMYARSKTYGQRRAMIRAAMALCARPRILQAGLDALLVFSDLVGVSAARGDRNEAFRWIERGRQADPFAARADHAAGWDFLELRLASRFDSPELWVPELSKLLNRYGQNPHTSGVLVNTLLEMGLAKAVRDPQNPEQGGLDLGPLRRLFTRYASRVVKPAPHPSLDTPNPNATSGSAKAAVSAKPAIWTPGSPGAGAGSGSAKPKIILPGQ